MQQTKQSSTRRSFLKGAGAGVGAVMMGGVARAALTAEAPPLIDAVKLACTRLAALGWRDMLLAVTDGALDIGAAALQEQLLKPLARIDRAFEGFGDFALAGTQGVQPGNPDTSLLYHAFASPTVVAGTGGRALGGFPTLAEIEALENFIYGVQAPTLAALRERAGGRPLGIAVFALHYRNTPDSVHGRHAQLCFSRSGVARVGTLPPKYDARKRLFVNVDQAKPFDFHVTPQRFAAYLAVRMPGDPASFGPQDTLSGDELLGFWVPLHKLFGGAECVAGMRLDVAYSRGVQNEELAQFHKYLDMQGLKNNWRGADLGQFPFTIRDERIASLSLDPEHGNGVLVPRAANMTEVARYKDKPLTFPVYPSLPKDLQMSSLFVIPGVTIPAEPAYQDDAEQHAQRNAPEYTNVRHRVNPDGTVDNLNTYPEMAAIVHDGGYQAQHYIDFTGDGWVAAEVPQLEPLVEHHLPAYCMVGLPDFFPQMTQRDLMMWSQNTVPKKISQALWVIQPLALSQTRIAANVTLPVGFSIKDVTITSIVAQLGAHGGPVQQPNGPLVRGKVGLPDGSPGLFDPGWDTSQGVNYSVIGERGNATGTLERYLAGYSLGSPFIEDAKLCAALGSYWPGVAPDATRTFQPGKRIGGEAYPWPTVVPLTDQEIGSAPLADGKFMPWDGVTGPGVQMVNGREMAVYTDIFRTDYIDLIGTMTAALTSRIDGNEYKARVLAMEAVYWNLGIRGEPGELSCHVGPARLAAPRNRRIPVVQQDVNRILRCKAAWAVLSFTEVDAQHAGLRQAQSSSSVKLTGPRLYYFSLFRWNPERPEERDPSRLDRVFVEMLERVHFYVDEHNVLIQSGKGPWKPGTPLPT